MKFINVYRLKKIIIIYILIVIFLSCASTTDITNDKILRGNYAKGMVLLLKKDVLIMKNGRLWDRQSDVNIVKEGSQKDRYKGILKKGNKLKIERIDLYQHIENGNYIYPMAQILTGEWKGEEVNLYFASVSSDRPSNDSYYVDILDCAASLIMTQIQGKIG